MLIKSLKCNRVQNIISLYQILQITIMLVLIRLMVKGVHRGKEGNDAKSGIL